MRKLKLFLSLLMLFAFSLGNVWAADYKKTALADITSSDVVIIVGNNGSLYALSNDKGTGSAPAAVSVSATNDVITTDATNILWNIAKDGNNLTIYPNGTTETWLYCTATNNGVRVGTNANKVFVIDNTNNSNNNAAQNDYLYNSATNRWLGVYNSSDWRCYTTIGANIKNQALSFYVLQEEGGDDVTVKTLKSIALSGQTTSFYQNAAFAFDGTCTATYSVTKNDVAQADEQKVVTPTSVSSPDMTTLGNKEVTVTFTDGEVSKEAKYTITVTEAPAAVNYELVTNANDLADAAEIIIVNIDEDKAISTTQASSNRTATAVSSTSHVIAAGDDVQVIILEASSSNWKLSVGEDSYLYASSNSSNQLKTAKATTAGDNGVWAITIANDGAATIVAQGTNGRNNMRYNPNNGSAMFSCYASTSTLGLVKIFKKVEGAVKPAAGLAYAEADQRKLTKLGDAFTAPTLVNPNNLTVAYTSNNTDVAEVNASTGAVTIKAAGVAVITASFDGNDDYKAGSASYTIGVTTHAGTQDDNYTVADAKIAIDAIDSKEGVYVSGIVNEANLNQDNIDQYHNATYWISDDGSAKEFEVFRGKYIANADVTSVEDIKVGDEVVVYGNITKFNNTYEFAEGNYLINLDRNKAAAGLSYTVLEIEKNIGDVAFTNELTNPNNLTVTYSSSNASVASVDAASGLVTINAMGTAVITASFGGNASYLEGEAAYTLIVNDPSLTKVTFDASNENDKTSSDDEWTLTKGDITLSISEGRLNTAEYRLYKDKVLTLTSSNGNIKRVELECTASGDTKYGPGSITAQEGYSYNGTIGVWVGDAASVELTAGNNQTRMSKINVYYIPDTRTAAGLAWDPADDIEITVGETFTAPTLLNPNSIDAAEITIESSNTSLVTVTAGVVALVADATGEATITATFAGNDDYKPATVSYNITVNAAAPTPLTDYYEKVTSGDVEEGTYLIVYEDASVAFDGGLETLDAENNTIDVEITNDNKIGVTQATAAATFYIDPTAGSIQAANGKYIGVGGNSNGLKTSDNADTYTHDFSIDGDGNAVIAPNFEGSTMSLRYNAASNQARFRYYKDNGQQAIQLYKLANETVKANPELAWSGDVEITLGDDFTAPTLDNPHSVEGITFASDNTDLATITNAGVIELIENATGTAHITASFAGNDDYKAASVSCTIIVNASAPTPLPTAEAKVIVVEYNSKFYAMSTTVKNSNGFEPIEVTKENDKIIVKSDEEAAAIQWQIALGAEAATFQNGESKYLACSTESNTGLALLDDASEWAWDATASCYKQLGKDSKERTFYYNYNNGNPIFRAYTVSGLNGESYSGAPEFITADKIEVQVPVAKADAELAFDPAEVSLTLGDDFTAPTLNYAEGFNGQALITYTSSKTAVAEVDPATGEVTIKTHGTTTITASFEGNDNYEADEASYTITVNKPAPTPTSTTYTKVTSTADITDGEYLIVYEGDNTHASVAFDGALTSLDAAQNNVAVTINEGVIAGNSDIDAAIFTIDITAGTLQSASGKFIGVTSNSNGLKQENASEKYFNTFAIDNDGNAVITPVFENSTMALRYNYGSNDLRFRYYGASNQRAIALYKKDVATPDYGSYQRDVTNGNYGTICLPQAGTIEGATLFEIGSFDNEMIYVDEVIGGVMEAGKPYIFQATADQLNVTYTSDTQVAASNANGLHGFYNLSNMATDEADKFDITEDAGNYILYQNAYWLVSGRAAYINNFRAYIKIGEINAQAPAPGRRRVAMAVHGEQVATGVENVQGDNVQCTKVLINGQLFILRGEKMYDAKGQLVK